MLKLWIARAQPALNARDQSFLEASRAAAKSRAEAEESDRRERETLLKARAEADQRNVSRLRMFLAVGSVLLLVALALLAYAINRQQAANQEAANARAAAENERLAAKQANEARFTAEQQTHIAESQARAAEALFDLTNGDPERALLLARTALLTDTQSYEPLVFRALHRTLEDTVSRQRLSGHTSAVNGASWSKDEQRVLTWSDDTTARVWVVEPRLLVAELSNRVCHLFSDAEITKALAGWRGCNVELAAVDADLKRYNSLWHPR